MWIYAATSSWSAESSLECWKFWQNLSCRVWYLPLLFHYHYKHHFLGSIQSWKKESKPKKPSRTAQFILHFCLFIESEINGKTKPVTGCLKYYNEKFIREKFIEFYCLWNQFACWKEWRIVCMTSKQLLM